MSRRSAREVLALLVAIAAFLLVAHTHGDGATHHPVRAVFYYPWFPESWHARDHYHPSLGQYSSDDASILNQHFAAMRYAGIDAVISSWWGQGDLAERTRFPAELRVAAAHGMKVAPYYEREGYGNTTLGRIRADLAYLKAYERTNPSAFLHVDGKPVVFVYNAASATSTCSTVTKWKNATNGFTSWYVNLKVFAGSKGCPDQPDSWHQYDPTIPAEQVGQHSYSISPGFWSSNDSAPRLARNVNRWRSNVEAMRASGANWQLVTTFNEWGEATAVESADDWASPSGYGTYLDVMHQELKR